MKNVKLLNALLLIFSGYAYSQSTEDISALVPQEFNEIPVVPIETQFENPYDQAQCRNGIRIGDALGKLFIQKINPSCDELLFKFKDEWVVPVKSKRTIKPLDVCFNASYAAAIQTTVLNTALNCSQQLATNFLLTQQLEYNRCYLTAAKQIGQLANQQGITFASVTEFVTGKYVLIPRDSERWNEFIDGLTVVIDDGVVTESAGLKVQACNLAIADALSKAPPRNFLAVGK